MKGVLKVKTNILPYSVDQWILNLILPSVDPKMSSLCPLEAKITLKQTIGMDVVVVVVSGC